MIEKINNNVDENVENSISTQVAQFIAFVKRYLPRCNRNLHRFKATHSRWVGGKIFINLKEVKSSQDKAGRKELTYEEAGSRLKRKLASDLASQEEHTTQLFIHAASVSAKKCKENDMAFVLRKTMHSENASEIRKKIEGNLPTSIEPSEALAFLIENGLTKEQYGNIKLICKQHGCDIFPSYLEVVKAKLKCRPNGISICEKKAEVPLQSLLNHTADRILKLQEDVLEVVPNATHYKLIVSYGFDGSTGQSSYKQYFQSDEFNTMDHSLFVSTIIPLRLTDEHNRIIWLNRTPQSIRFCRPLKIEFVKETTAVILNEKNIGRSK
ncbi:uncharacterized protein LOC122757015 [Drosophila mojavensis]|uniref:uncharacterized protein LOC122757015 n=1 Tax=Drosophila mojavensis TaxID=7230 RepID=UPI001CD0A94D|nr:uncharacterized protein LOC122757015 [Drosophila mojavensis]